MVVTHLTPRLPHNLRINQRFWENTGALIDRRLSLYNEEGAFPRGIEQRPEIQRIICSESGALDDLPYHALDEGFAGPGFKAMVLGGGFMDDCLVETFRSLIWLKSEQGEKSQIIMPLPLIYSYRKMDGMAYIRNKGNHYMSALQEAYSGGDISGFHATLTTPNGVSTLDYRGYHHSVELHWFTNLEDMFTSPLFPDVSPSYARAILSHV